jgi:integrase/recombinase XerC
VIDKFRDYLVEERMLSENTIDSYLADVKTFIKWFEKNNGQFQPLKVIPFDIKKFIDQSDLKPSTKNRRIASIYALFDYFVCKKIVDMNPVSSVRNIKISKINLDRQWLSIREQNQLLYEIDKEQNEFFKIRDSAMIRVMLNCGLRLNEVRQLEIQDVDLIAGTITIRNGKGGKYRVQTIATEKKHTFNAISEWKKKRPNVNTNYLFVSSRAKQMSDRVIQTTVQKYADKAGLGKVSPHQLRHSCGKNLIDANYPIQLVAEILGHESIETTRRYITPGQEELGRAINDVEQ